MKIPKEIKTLMYTIHSYGKEAYIIGGAVRDFYLGKEPHDYDIFTNASGDEILKMFPHGKVIGNDERQKKILTVIVDGVEISTYRKSGDRTKTGATLKEHINTCDFTVNAIAVDIEGNVIDLVNGLDDIKCRVLRFVGNPQLRINECPKRILRGIRFWDEFGCFEDLSYVMKNLYKLDLVPKENIRDELLKILATKHGLENLWCDGVIYKIIPMLKTIENIPGGKHHKETVKNHLMYSFNHAKRITDNPMIWLAALLHDIGKGDTLSTDMISKCCSAEVHEIDTGVLGQIQYHCTNCKKELQLVDIENEIHFYDHENKGMEMVREWMEEYKFSKDDITFVTTLIRLHMYSYKSKPGKKSYMRFFAKLKNAKIDILDYIMILYCDNQGNQRKKRIKFGDFVKGNWLLQKYWECIYTNEPFTVKDMVIGGKNLIERYKLNPGKRIGQILKTVHDKIIDGDLRNEKAEIFHYLEKEYFN